MEPTIRAAAVEDARAIAEVHVASWKAAYADILDLDNLAHPLDVGEREQSWRDRIPRVGDEGFRTWVAELDGTVVGYAFTRPTEDDDLNPLEVAEVVALYLHPDHFGAGIGRALLERAVAGIRNQGFLQGTLWVLEGNTRAIHFYRREGWRPDGARAACYRALNAPALRLRLPL
ncbi:MAG: GNAT family N-acetyltransferase [Actinobacteria bacterium]|nr:GNAT family N-acetyltransferase [Actinomycetota bacterium]